jgi:hypothetical protein
MKHMIGLALFTWTPWVGLALAADSMDTISSSFASPWLLRQSQRDAKSITTNDVDYVNLNNETDVSELLSQSPFQQLEHYRKTRQKLLQERMRLARENRRNRHKQRTTRGIRPLVERPLGLQRLTFDELVQWENATQSQRGLAWFSGGSGWGGSEAFSSSVLADPSQYYDKWAQAYRMLGGFIDCDHSKSEDDHHSGDNKNNNKDKQKACSRWMMWAAVSFPYLSRRCPRGFVEWRGWS